MSDGTPFYAPNQPPRPAPTRTPGELLFEFTARHKFYRCELRTDAHGVETQIFEGGELLISHRHDTRGLAVLWAEEMRKALEAPRC